MTEKRVWVAFFLLGMLLMLGRWGVTGSVIGGDAVYYFMQMRSLVLDQDLNFQNEYAHFHEEKSSFTGNPKIPKIPSPNPETGKLPNKYPVGVALLLLPFYVLAHALSLLLSLMGISVSTDGYGVAYQLASGFGNLCYGLCGIKLIHCLGTRWFPTQVSLYGACVVLLATPLLYYMTMEPILSHTLSMFATTALVFFWLRARENTQNCDWLALGALAGICALIRYQDGLFILMPILDLLLQSVQHKRKATRHGGLYAFGVGSENIPHGGRDDRCYFNSILRCFLFLTLGAILLFSVQLFINKFLCGSFFETGYVSESFPFWRSPKLIGVLFSKECGLITWSPILLFALIGFFSFSKRVPYLGVPMAISFLTQWFLVSSWDTPGDSFGNRMLLNASVFYALGLMQIFSKARTSSTLFPWVPRITCFFIAVNAALSTLYCFRVIGHPY